MAGVTRPLSIGQYRFASQHTQRHMLHPQLVGSSASCFLQLTSLAMPFGLGHEFVILVSRSALWSFFVDIKLQDEHNIPTEGPMIV